MRTYVLTSILLIFFASKQKAFCSMHPVKLRGVAATLSVSSVPYVPDLLMQRDYLSLGAEPTNARRPTERKKEEKEKNKEAKRLSKTKTSRSYSSGSPNRSSCWWTLGGPFPQSPSLSSSRFRFQAASTPTTLAARSYYE